MDNFKNNKFSQKVVKWEMEKLPIEEDINLGRT
jgi:hypothetical protein